MKDIAIQGHLPHIGPGVGNTRLGHAPLYLGQLVLCDHHMKVSVTLAPGRQRSSSSRLRLWAGGSFTLSSSFFSGPFGSGEGGRLFKIPSSILPFCSSESSTVSRWLSFSFIASFYLSSWDLLCLALSGSFGGSALRVASLSWAVMEGRAARSGLPGGFRKVPRSMSRWVE